MYWLIHHTKNIASYKPKFMTQLLLTAARLNLHKKISYCYQVSLWYSMGLVDAPVWKTKNLSNLVSPQELIQLMILTKNQGSGPVLQERQDWIPPQIKDLKLVIPEYHTFMASNILFIALDILEKHLEKTTQIKSTLPPWLIQNFPWCITSSNNIITAL